MQGNCTQFFIFILKALASGTSCLDANAFVFSQKTPRTNLKYNINSPNFFITNFNDMKRMNFIRVALFAVFAFMGTISLSAQTWLPPAAAIVVITNELDQLNDLPVPTPTNVIGTSQQVQEQNAQSGLNCSACAEKAVREAYLTLTLLRLKSGMDTGASVEEVRSLMVSGSGNSPSMLSAIQSGFLYMDNIL